MQTYVVALTGGIGSGKSEAAKVFAELGVPVTDLDAISRQLTAANQPLIAQIAALFGEAYITPEGALNRPAMRALVFNDAAARAKLNALIHPAIYDVAVKQLQANQLLLTKNIPYQILDIPLLVETPRYLPHINRVLVIDCSETTQIERVKQRSQLAEDEIKKIIAAQTPRHQLLKLADDVIENDKNVTELRKKIKAIHQKYLNTCIVSKTI
jgi:dephospho-CoA kinase